MHFRYIVNILKNRIIRLSFGFKITLFSLCTNVELSKKNCNVKRFTYDKKRCVCIDYA